MAIEQSSPRQDSVWTAEVVVFVLRKERTIYELMLEPFFVDEHGLTGGAVIRTPWSSTGYGRKETDWAIAKNECKQLNAAFVHGFLMARRQECLQSELGCVILPSDGYCSRCGGSIPP